MRRAVTGSIDRVLKMVRLSKLCAYLGADTGRKAQCACLRAGTGRCGGASF